MQSKHEVIRDWVQPFLENNYLYFETANAYPGVRTLVPNYGDYVRFQDITGAKYRSYSFVFVGYEQIDTGTSDVNIRNLELFDDFMRWVEEQKESENFPNFGDNCSEYDIIILQNMANLSFISDDNLAKYMFGVQIDYKED